MIKWSNDQMITCFGTSGCLVSFFLHFALVVRLAFYVFLVNALRIFTNRALHTLNRNLLCCVRYLDAKKIEWPIHRVFSDKDGSHWKGLEKCNQIDVEGAANKRLELVKLQQHLSFADDPTECFPYGAEWCPALRLHICILVLFLKARESIGTFGVFVARGWRKSLLGGCSFHLRTTPGSKKLRDDPVINNRVPTENLYTWLCARFFLEIFMCQSPRIDSDRQV